MPDPLTIPTVMTVDLKQAILEVCRRGEASFEYAYPVNSLDHHKCHAALQRMRENFKSIELLLTAVK